MRNAWVRREKYRKKVRGFVLPGQGDRYRNNIMPRIKLEQCVKAAGVTPMLQFSYVAYLEELLKHDAARRTDEAQGIIRKWQNRGLDGPTLLSTAACIGMIIEPFVPPIPCTDWDNKIECEGAGCCWTGLHCITAPCSCSDYETQFECEANGCFWYDDACHDALPVCEYDCDVNTVGLWHCDDGAGVQASDSCAPLYHLAFKGPGEPAWTTTYHCPTHALHFDGNDDYIFHPTLADAGMSNGTMEMWFKPDVQIDDTHAGYIYLWLKGGGASEYHTLRWEPLDGRLSFFLRSVSQGNVTLYSTTNPFLAGKWYHVAVTWGSTGTKLYICGVQEDSDPSTQGMVAGTVWDFFVGGVVGYTDSFDGIIDEIRLSDVQRVTFTIPGACPE